MLGRHLLISAGLVGGWMLLTGMSPANALPIYLAFLLPAVPAFHLIQLGTDRAEGTLEFLCGLPVAGHQLALGRVLSLLEGCVLAGAVAGIASIAFLADELGPVGTAALGVAGFSGATIFLLAVGICLSWLALRFSPQTMVASLLLLLLVAAMLGPRLLPPLGPLWDGLHSLRDSPASLFGAALILSGLIAIGAFQLLARTFTRLVRDPARARVTKGGG